jgi:signal transduction histidine kinase
VGKVCHEVYGHLTRRGIGGPICDSICPLRHDGGTDGAVQFTPPPGSQPRTLAVTCSTLRDEDGNVVGGVDLLRDVTAQAEAERTKEAVIRHVSHELRTPLTSISSGAMLLLRKGDNLSAAQRDGILEGIVSGSKKLERIAQILTDMAAFEAGQMHITLRPMRAGDLVGEVVAQWRTRAPDRDVRAVGARLAAAVEADRELIVRALDELVDNAIKFSPSGGPVTVRAGAADGGVEYSVQDRGIGLDPSRVDYLLQEFTQADLSEVRTAGGLGVGLPYVRRILEGHGTDLRVQSRPGKGATFSFVLRRATEAKGKRAAKRPARRRKARR